MSHVVFFALLSVVGALLLFLGTRAQKLAKVLLILLGIVMVLPGIYGLLTTLF